MVYVLLWCVVLWWVLLGCVLLWCDVVLCYAVLYGRRNLTKNPSLKLSGKFQQGGEVRHPRTTGARTRTGGRDWTLPGLPCLVERERERETASLRNVLARSDRWSYPDP